MSVLLVILGVFVAICVIAVVVGTLLRHEGRITDLENERVLNGQRVWR